MAIVTQRVAARPRAFMRAHGPDAADFLQRMLSNDVEQDADVFDALLLTPKGRLIAPLRVWRLGADEFLLGTEPELGNALQSALVRARFAAKVELELEEHTSALVWSHDFSRAEERVDADVEPNVDADVLERLRIEAGVPVWGQELDESVLPAEAGLDSTHISYTKGCYPGQEPIARLHYRGHVNRSLRVLDVDSAEPGEAIVLDGKNVGRVTSAVPGVALGYVRREVPDDADLNVGGKHAKMRPA
ncbi:MAG: CAF17-like 4Fe-4S cluster assembly/insertion protein YgfZ [Gaiellaceae bacterium]